MCTAMEIFIKKTENIGYERGESVGIKKGKQLGIKEDRQVLITNMHNNGLTVVEIVKFISLRKEEVYQYLNI